MDTAKILSEHLAGLLRAEHVAMADFLVALADFDRRRLWRDLGHASLFYYLHRELRLSTGAAFHRKTAAKLLQRFPEVAEPLRDGRLCLSSVVELARVLTPANREEVLPRFFHRSRREAQAVAVEIRPAAVVVHREMVTAVERRVAAPAAALAAAPAPAEAARPETGAPAFHLDEMDATRSRLGAPTGERPGAAAPPSSTTGAPAAVGPDATASTDAVDPRAGASTGAPTGARNGATPAAAAPAPPPPTATAVPLTSELRRLHVTVSRRFLQKLDAARAGMSHAVPGASAEQVLEAALDLLLRQQAKGKGLVERPRKQPRPCKPEHIPAEVRRSVWLRDGGRCQWPVRAGGICGATHRLEYDHVVPRARGGPPTEANLRLLCRFHNQLAARRAFGDAFVDQFAPSG